VVSLCSVGGATALATEVERLKGLLSASEKEKLNAKTELSAQKLKTKAAEAAASAAKDRYRAERADRDLLVEVRKAATSDAKASALEGQLAALRNDLSQAITSAAESWRTGYKEGIEAGKQLARAAILQQHSSAFLTITCGHICFGHARTIWHALCVVHSVSCTRCRLSRYLCVALSVYSSLCDISRSLRVPLSTHVFAVCMSLSAHATCRILSCTEYTTPN
jgi:hypothetical protein